MFSADTWITVSCSLMVNAVLFGVGVTTVLAVPALAVHAKYLIPAVVAVSILVAPFIARQIGRRMRLRNWGAEKWRQGDSISG